MSADAEAVDGVSLVVEGEDGVLVDVVGGDDGQIGEPGNVVPERTSLFDGHVNKVSKCLTHFDATLRNVSLATVLR